RRRLPRHGCAPRPGRATRLYLQSRRGVRHRSRVAVSIHDAVCATIPEGVPGNGIGIPPGSVPVSTQGGGIFVGASKLRMTNSTISNNTSSGPGGQTAAIGNHQGEVTLNNVTIADNTAAGFIGGVEAGARKT